MKTQSGNALFMILIAIFLLGALTALVARTGGNTEETGDLESASIKISEMMRYVSGVKETVEKLKLNGCSENTISFEKSPFDGTDTAYVNSNSPPSFECFVFHPRGGGLTAKSPPSVLLDGLGGAEYGNYIYTSELYIDDIGTAVYPYRGDLMILIPSITDTICKELNRRLGIDPKWVPEEDDLTHANVTSAVKFTGGFTHATSKNIDGYATWGFGAKFWDGKMAGCTKTNDAKYVFFYVIHPH